MLTPDEVVHELKERGYELTLRRLVDWRQKALLPPLVKRGRRQGRGWVYGWEDPLVVDQAIAVQELLWIHGHTDWLYVPLWCLGFDVPLERVRSRLLAMVETRRSRLTGGEMDPEELGFRLSELAVSLGRRPGPRRGHPQLPAEAAEFWFNLLAGDAEYAPDETTLAAIAAMVWGMTGGYAPAGAWRLSGQGLHQLQRWVRQHVAMPRLEEAARNASEGEWEAVHADWQALARLERALQRIAAGEEWERFHELWRRVVAVLGPWLTLVDLSIRRHEPAPHIDRALQDVVDFASRLGVDPDLQRQVRENWPE